MDLIPCAYHTQYLKIETKNINKNIFYQEKLRKKVNVKVFWVCVCGLVVFSFCGGGVVCVLSGDA